MTATAIPTAIRGVTFDFWQTLFFDRHEPQRMRVRAVGIHDALAAHGHHRPVGTVLAAVLACSRHRAGLDEDREFTPIEQVRWVLANLSVDVNHTPGLLADVAAPYCEGGLVVPPEAFDDAPAVLANLAEDHRLALICNTGSSPGVVLRNTLRRAGLLDYFTTTVFSDELGWRKPHPAAFAAAIAGLGLQPAECVHVGDDPWTDGHGAKVAGMSAILLVGGEHGRRPVRSSHDLSALRPDATVPNLRALPVAIRSLTPPLSPCACP